MNKFIKLITPPIILSFFRKRPEYGFFGNYNSWQEALSNSKGYANPKILEKVSNSVLRVKNGEYKSERDSVLLDRIEHSPITTYLLWIASLNENSLSLIDFGGSLGSSYFNNLSFLKHLKILKWNVVEQENFVDEGKKYFQDNNLNFFNDLEECLRKEKYNVVLFSSSIQYVEKPYDILKRIIDNKIEYIIIDRTSFHNNKNIKDTIVIQKVPPRIYDASYPCWVLNEDNLKKFLIQNNYECLDEFSTGKSKVLKNHIKELEFKGFIFKLIK